ncbi:hypothetical protein ACFYY8_31370 [Streptosporangium sp. NPDC001559]|uniref:hypothetical protein n=1 Tax=Streptosporangium sp. NPDC001559 TaxID=3366187 RepID=UPI0036F0DE8F
MAISIGQVYESCHPLDEGRRIRVVGMPVNTKVLVESLPTGGRGARRRNIETSQLHDSATTRSGAARRTGYALVEDVQ